jgi:hypothetical protein
MFISIVIPTLSRSNLLQEAVQSIARQTHNHWEVVIVDDGSEPALDSNLIAEILGNRFRLLRHNRTVGTAAAKNTGVANARGELITILDDDDLFLPDALEQIVNVFNHHNEIECLFINIEPFGSRRDIATANQNTALNKLIVNAESHRSEDVIFFGPNLFPALLQTTPIAMQRPVARPAIWRKIGEFTPGIICPEPVWATKAALLCNVALFYRPIYKWRIGDQNFASRDEMRYQSSMSILSDRLRLLRSLATSDYAGTEVIQSLRSCIATSLLGQAVELKLLGHYGMALRLWCKSLRYSMNISTIRVLLRLLLPASLRG